MKTKYLFAILFLLTSTLLFGCNAEKKINTNEVNETTTPSERLKIFTTVYPLQDFTEKIGGEHVEVKSVFPIGADAHTFEPTTKTMVEIAEADALLYIGAGVEGFITAASKAMNNEKVQLVKTTEGMKLAKAEREEPHYDEDEDEAERQEDHSNESHSHDAHEDESETEHSSHNEHEEHHHHGDVDPHVWLDPVLSIELAENVLHTLEQLKPEAKDDFERNFKELRASLLELDKDFQDLVNQSPKKKILVSHSAYGYWESRYGIQQLSVSGLSPSNEPTQKALKNIINTANKYNIKFVIFDQNLSSKAAEVVKNELNAESLTLHNLESITAADDANGADYFSIMKQNLDTLRKALN
ncbi:zinc ABC transporter substrate-binding protein [Bacillus sp. JJ1566]|uniref:metal ABC transporter solute-binding protein, Zn/Mn family n=1 Tax=Bacillus sp. JJ1566 TaxID=3122961 RepID=UPI002FFF9CA7